MPEEIRKKSLKPKEARRKEEDKGEDTAPTSTPSRPSSFAVAVNAVKIAILPKAYYETVFRAN